MLSGSSKPASALTRPKPHTGCTLETLKSVAFPQPAQTGTNMQTKIPLS